MCSQPQPPQRPGQRSTVCSGQARAGYRSTIWGPALPPLILVPTAYEGAMLLVSHDTDFVRALTPNRVIVMPQAEIRLFS